MHLSIGKHSTQVLQIMSQHMLVYPHIQWPDYIVSVFHTYPLANTNISIMFWFRYNYSNSLCLWRPIGLPCTPLPQPNSNLVIRNGWSNAYYMHGLVHLLALLNDIVTLFTWQTFPQTPPFSYSIHKTDIP